MEGRLAVSTSSTSSTSQPNRAPRSRASRATAPGAYDSTSDTSDTSDTSAPQTARAVPQGAELFTRHLARLDRLGDWIDDLCTEIGLGHFTRFTRYTLLAKLANEGGTALGRRVEPMPYPVTRETFAYYHRLRHSAPDVRASRKGANLFVVEWLARLRGQTLNDVWAAITSEGHAAPADLAALPDATAVLASSTAEEAAHLARYRTLGPESRAVLDTLANLLSTGTAAPAAIIPVALGGREEHRAHGLPADPGRVEALLAAQAIQHNVVDAAASDALDEAAALDEATERADGNGTR